ncbi:MAG: response regulator [Tannerella sp.]|nr:response regulator [Tannerella sp.]
MNICRRKGGFIFLLFYITQTINPVYFRQIGIRDGLSQISVMSIYQDELGRMWFGTEEGLSVYDGKGLVSFKHSEDSLLSHKVPVGNETFPVTGDRNGSVYFRSDDRFIRYDIKKERFHCLKSGNVSTVFCKDSAVLVAAADTVYAWESETASFRYVTHVDKPNTVIYKLFIDSDARLWIGARKGLFVQDDKKQLQCILAEEDIFEIFEDSQANVWIATRNAGMYRRDRQGILRKFTHLPGNPNSIPHNQVRSFAEDGYGNIWIGTFLGLCKYNPATEEYTVYKKDNLPGALQHSSVFSTCRDAQGSIWVGTYYGGVHHFNPEADCFSYYSSNSARNDCLSHFFVGKITEDRDQNLWICTEGGGLNFFDRKTKTFRHFTAGGNKNSIAHNNLKCITYSSKYDKLYIGTHTGGLSIYDIRSGAFFNFRDEKPEYHRMTGDVIIRTALYGEDTLIIRSRSGFYKMDLETQRLSPLFDTSAGMGGNLFFIDSNDYFWLANASSILKINMNNRQDITCFDRKKKGAGSFAVSCIFEDSRGQLFFGTAGSGLYRYNSESGDFTACTAGNNRLYSDYCYDIARSGPDELVISGDKGLSFLNTEDYTLKTIGLDALMLSGINRGCGLLVCRDGEIFAGGIGGLTSFFTRHVFGVNKDYALYFSSLSVNDERIEPDDKTKILQQAIPFTDRIVLNHKQNSLNIAFASTGYFCSQTGGAYEYRLEGFDSKWIAGDRIIYTNIDPGKYTLRVREKKTSPGAAPSKTASLEIVIRHAWYANPYAFAFYFIIVYVILFSFMRFLQVRQRLKTSLELERKEKERIEQLNQSKLQFFSGISHEFHTPLTLIIVQVERLLNSSGISPFLYGRLLKINRNAVHLRNLASELLDFRKLEQGHIRLKVREQNLIPFLKEIYLSFLELSSERNITYRFDSCGVEEILCWYDPKQMRKTFCNLISNAFKYTKPNDSIEISVKEEPDAIVIKVIDSGIGIKKEDIDRIFDCFYQVDDGRPNTIAAPSTGIGLSMAKSILELHHASVSVESKPAYGSIFVVSLKKGNSHFSPDELLSGEQNEPPGEEIKLAVQPEKYALPPDTAETDAGTEKKGTVLVVEDNDELLQLLQDILSPIYSILSAHDGAEGLELTRRHRPDLVISDIMMPGMSGTEMCMTIKNDFETCHIPVILLTALSSTEHSIYGLQHGADDYIGKPFHEKALIARCNNLIRNRLIIKNKFSRNLDFDIQSISNNPIDQKFLDTVNRIIEENFDNPAFNINTLARELTISRSSLYAKFEALTGMTPNDYALQRKLKKAADLLRSDPSLNISEISDALGFSSPRYFSRCFKKQFTLSPAAYRKPRIT